MADFLSSVLDSKFLPSALNFLGTQDTNQANKEIAQQNNAWSASQFASRYQTTVSDMEKAGLNPMLAYSQGGGSPPTAQQVQMQNPTASATQAYHQSAERDVMKQAIEKSRAEVSNVVADTALKRAQEITAGEQAKLATAQTAAQQQIERDAMGRANLSAVDLVRRGHGQSSTIKQTEAQTKLTGAQEKTQGVLAASYISQMAVNKATIVNLLSMSNRNTAEGDLAKARIKEAVAKGEISTADIERARNDERYEKSTGGLPRQIGRDLSTIGSARTKFKK